MLDTTTQTAHTIQIELLAQEIVSRLQNTEPGHCARVDFLTGTEAQAICLLISKQHLIMGVAFHILTTNRTIAQADPLYITTDKAIEIRNRKLERLCLFIPSDIVDAASSSIANSFAPIDGRTLYSLVLKQVRNKLTPELTGTVSSVFSRLRFMTGISEKQRLDFTLALFVQMQAGKTAELGMELWRVGLIVDASNNFVANLDRNRDCAVALSHPTKLGATTRERIQSIKVDAATVKGLEQFFRGHSLNDVRTWSRELATQPGLTFDCWTFPESDPSDIRTVTIASFLNPKNEVEKYCRLQQPDGPGGSLIAHYGTKESIVVRWVTEPKKTSNLSRWRIAIVPDGSEPGFDDAIEERTVAGTRRTVTIKLDTDYEELLDSAVRIRIAPISEDGSEILSEEGKPLFHDSDEFYLIKGTEGGTVDPPRTSISTTLNIALGRLEAAVEMRETVIEETDEQWSSKDLEYFRLRVNNRRVLNIGLSKLLLELERQIIAEPRKNCCFTLDIDEVRPVLQEQFSSYPLQTINSDAWVPFWRSREAFFKRLKQAEMRRFVEVVEWTPELGDVALRYAKAYRDLIDTLIKNRVEPSELREALSIDTLLIKNTSSGEQPEEAVVVLPTHPLRVAWFASYAQLLLQWEENLLDLPQRERKRNLDLQALHMLTPMNTPTFVYHAASSKTFTFFQNMRFFYGVALPANIPDPHRLFTDISTILNTPLEQTSDGDMQPNQLAEHLKHFRDLHPYTETLVATLVNPGRGDFFADAVKEFVRTRDNDEHEEIQQPPALQITAYSEGRQKSTFQAFETVRQQQLDQRYNRIADPFLPGLTITARSVRQLEQSASAPEAHIAVITDFTRPTIVASSTEGIEASSFSLYGLINRFISQFIPTDGDFLWRHRIVTGGVRRPEQHPVNPRYTDTLVELQTSLLDAGGYLLGGPVGTHPMLEVHLDAKKRELLERLHTNTNWVITLDRYFTLDYYDSPYQQELHDVARKYVLDYSPEFTEGLGHRMMVTTAWHEEIGSLLSQAMDNLGFSSIEQSVSQLLHYLKTVSGRLALDALESSTSAAAAVGLGVVTAWLQRNKRLRQAILLPVDIYPRLFSPNGTGKSERGERRCDMVLVSLQRNIVNATFIEVKWRRGRTPLEDLAQDMLLQMEGSAQAMKNRFFNPQRVDGALQRSYLANVLRFYFERSRRYQLFDTEAENAFLENLTKLEKTGLEFRPTYEGYIVSLESEQRKPLLMGDAKFTLLTAKSFEGEADLTPTQTSSFYQQSTGDIPRIVNGPVDEDEYEDVDDTKEEVDTLKIPTIQSPSQEGMEEVVPDGTPSPKNTNDVNISLGEASGVPVEWMPGVKGSPHLFILGIPGQGKSWTTTRLLTELGQQHVPSLVLDFHGQFADPDGPFVQKVHPHVLDASQGLPFSPFEYTKDNGPDSWMANATTVSEIFAYVAGLGDMQRDVLYTAIRDAYRALEFEDSDTHATVAYPTLKDVMRRIEQNEQARHVGNVIARTRPLLEMDLFRPTKNAADFLSLVRDGMVIDLHNLYSEMLQVAAGAFVLRKIYRDMFRWGTADRLRLAIVLDEAHRLAKDVTLPKLMKEGRKFGIAVIVASQGLGDFHSDVLGNTGTKIIFRMNFPESHKVSRFISTRQGQDIAAGIALLPVGSAYVQTPEMKYGTVVKMHPLTE